MSRANHNKKNNVIVWITIICILGILVAFYIIRNPEEKGNIGEISNNAVNNTVNTQVEEPVNNEVENEVTENTENTVTEDVSENTEISNKTQKEPVKPSTPGITDKKQKAIDLVKKEWGEDDTVNYVFDYVNEKGEYVIAVKDRATATVKNYFRVNLETETVELD